MLVSISDAAKMADVSRETFYRHIDDKKISIIDAGTNRPKVDVSELQRVYGDKLKPLEKVVTGKKKKTANDSIPPELAAENAVLKEKIQMLETFADRERRQLNDQIENLQESLKKEQETLSKVTAMLSDQRSEAEKKASQENQQAQKLADLEKLVKDLAEQQKATKKGWWFFGK